MEGCNTRVKATEMPSQPGAISCGQAAGTIIGRPEVSGDMLQRKSYMSQGIGNMLQKAGTANHE